MVSYRSFYRKYLAERRFVFYAARYKALFIIDSTATGCCSRVYLCVFRISAKSTVLAACLCDYGSAAKNISLNYSISEFYICGAS